MPHDMPRPLDIRAAGEELLGERWQATLAYVLGVSLRTVQRWANGQNAVPEPIAERIADLLATVRRCRTEAAAERARQERDDAR